MILIAFLILLSTGVVVTKSFHTVAEILTDKSDYNPGETVTISGFCFVIITDKAEYNPEEVVTIKGYGFQPNAEINVEVIRPDSAFGNWLVDSDTGGLFFATYEPDATTGMYIVKASDGVSGTETSFMVKTTVAPK